MEFYGIMSRLIKLLNGAIICEWAKIETVGCLN